MPGLAEYMVERIPGFMANALRAVEKKDKSTAKKGDSAPTNRKNTQWRDVRIGKELNKYLEKQGI